MTQWKGHRAEFWPHEWNAFQSKILYSTFQHHRCIQLVLHLAGVWVKDSNFFLLYLECATKDGHMLTVTNISGRGPLNGGFGLLLCSLVHSLVILNVGGQTNIWQTNICIISNVRSDSAQHQHNNLNRTHITQRKYRLNTRCMSHDTAFICDLNLLIPPFVLISIHLRRSRVNVT